MKRSSIKFLYRVRIHGGEFDASARAMHRDGMTSSFQAAVETVSIATIERKQMSTKTTFKRVALVAVASMGFGLLSVVPSSATPLGDTLTLDVTGTTSATVAEGETATAVVTQKYTSLADGDSMTVQAVLTDYPTGGSAAVIKLDTADSLTGTIAYPAGAAFSSSAGGASTLASVSAAAAGSIMASYNVRIVGAPVAGTYKVGLFPTKYTGATASAASAPALSWTVVVTAADLGASAALSTSFITSGDAIPAVVDSATVSGSKAIDAAQAATILVTQVNSAGTANESMTVTVSGPGSVSSGTNPTRTANAGRAITVKNTDLIGVWSDGSSGVATITITGATSGVVLGIETVTFYGAVASLTPSVRTSVVSNLGGNSSGASAILVVAKDSLGTVIPAGTVYLESSAQTSIPDVTNCAWSATYKAHACTLAPVAGKTGTVSFTARTAARATTVAATTVSSASTVSVTLGEAPAKVALSWDKSQYLPGEIGKLSVTVTDKNGKPVANGIYADIFDAEFIDSTYSLGTSLDTHTVTAATSTGTMVLSVNMPVAEVEVAVTAVTGTGFSTLADQGVDVAAPVVAIKSASGSAATDAANEATDAANAATDAANAAAEAADAATAAAQDAADAVAALSTQVAELISALKAQITSLTNLVIKIQKKVKA